MNYWPLCQWWRGRGAYPFVSQGYGCLPTNIFCQFLRESVDDLIPVQITNRTSYTYLVHHQSFTFPPTSATLQLATRWRPSFSISPVWRQCYWINNAFHSYKIHLNWSYRPENWSLACLSNTHRHSALLISFITQVSCQEDLTVCTNMWTVGSHLQDLHSYVKKG